MSFQATLEIDGKSMDILRCASVISQKSDMNGLPASNVLGGDITVFLSGNTDDTTDIADKFGSWITDTTKTYDGKLRFLPIDDSSKLRELEFTGAYLTELTESFMSDEEINYTTRVMRDPGQNFIFQTLLSYHRITGINYLLRCVLSAETIKLNGVAHDNKW